MYSFTVEFSGKWPSVNDLRNKHWRSLQGEKSKWRRDLGFLILEQNPKKLNNFSIEVRYNSRHDTDNVTLKFFCDALKDQGVIVDDNKKYFKSLLIMPDLSMKHNTFEFKVIEWQA